MQKLFEDNAGLEGKTVFEFLQRQNPGRFQDGQVRTLQRRVKVWRATEGPAREVFFAPLLWLVSPDSDGMTGRRLVATRWRTDLGGREAAEAATDQAGW